MGDHQMSDPTFHELLESYEAALDAAHRSIRIARALAEGCRSRLHPPDDVVEAYLACVERDEEQVKELLEKCAELKSRSEAVRQS
jgi:hypothetical protein